MKSLHRSLAIFSFLLVTSFLLPVSVSAQSAWSGRCVTQTDVATIQGFECLFGNILQVIVGVAGIIFFLMFINGGFQYLFSSNDQKKVAASSSTLTMAFMGLAGAIISYLILNFIKTITGADVVNFVIPGP